MSTKKMSVIVLVLILTTSIFTGCREKKTEQQPISQKTAQESVTPPSYDTNSNSTAQQTKSPKKSEPLTPSWNTSDIDALTNGNLPIAIELVRNNPNISSKSVEANAGKVIKRPWDYYGKVLHFTGMVALVQDYPPNSDLGLVFQGECSEIVMESNGGIVDTFVIGSASHLSEGQMIDIYAYPTGVTEVPNRLGGTFTQLICVGILR